MPLFALLFRALVHSIGIFGIAGERRVRCLYYALCVIFKLTKSESDELGLGRGRGLNWKSISHRAVAWKRR